MQESVYLKTRLVRHSDMGLLYTLSDPFFPAFLYLLVFPHLPVPLYLLYYIIYCILSDYLVLVAQVVLVVPLILGHPFLHVLLLVLVLQSFHAGHILVAHIGHL